MTEINISKIKINENDLIIKDAQARENINSLSTDINKLYNNSADKFSSTNSYEIGDYVIYNNNLYRFTSSHTPGDWNLNHVEQVRLSSEIQQKITDVPNNGNTYGRIYNGWVEITGEGSGGIGLGDTVDLEEDSIVITTGDRPINDLYNNISFNDFLETKNYNKGDYVIYEGKLYKFTSDHIQLPWDEEEQDVERINITDELKLKADFAKEILFFGTATNNAMTISAGTNQIIGTITDSLITSNMVLLNCTFANPSYITSDIQWETNNGSITLSGTCTAATSADITLGLKGN